jgi:hypothetical protein
MLIILTKPDECTLCFTEIEAGHTALSLDHELLCRRCGYDISTTGMTRPLIPRRADTRRLEEHHRTP